MFNVNVVGSPMWYLCLMIIYLSTYLCCKCITYVMGTFVCQLVSMLIEIPMLGLITFIYFCYSIQLLDSQKRLIGKKGRNLGMNGCVFCVVWVHGNKRLFCNIISKTSTTCDSIPRGKKGETFGPTLMVNASKSMPR